MVEGGGFEPPKAEPADLQSAPFDRSGIPPSGKPIIMKPKYVDVKTIRIFLLSLGLQLSYCPQAFGLSKTEFRIVHAFFSEQVSD